MAEWKNPGRDRQALATANDVLGTDSADNSQATTLVAANRDGSILERLEAIYAAQVDDAATNFIGVDDSNNVAATTNVAANRDGSLLERSEFVMDSFLALPRCVAKTDGAVVSGTDAIFTVSGGPVRATLYGIVTTILSGTGNGKITYTTTDPAATVDLCSAVAIDNDASGTSYRFINTTAVLTPVTAGVVIMGNAFATDDTEFFLPIGSMGFNSTGAATGVIAWYLMYTPLSPDARVVAAA
jgi:hypothetical protein